MTTNEREFETLSAVMDGEADELELRRVLDATSSDPALRAKWRRQQMVRELLQTRRISQPTIEVSSAVTESVDWRKKRYRNPLWSMAVAASVTMAVVLGGQQLLVPQNSVMQGSVVSDVVGGVVPVLGAQPVQASLGARSLPVAGGKSIRLTMSDEKWRQCMSGWRKIVTVIGPSSRVGCCADASCPLYFLHSCAGG